MKSITTLLGKYKAIRKFDKRLSTIPMGGKVYRFLKNIMLPREGKENWKIHDWVVESLAFAKHHHLVDFSFTKDGAFAKSVQGVEYWFHEDFATGMLHDIIRGGMIEVPELLFITQHIPDQCVVLDIGAGIGEYALSIAAQKAHAHIYAFEPTPEAYTCLEKNIARNKMENRITILPTAIAHFVGECWLLSTSDGNYITKDKTEAYRQGNAIPFHVPVTTIDVFMKEHNITHVDFIKVDIEGRELWLLEGAEQCIATCKPLIQLEIDTKHTRRLGYEPEVIFSFLSKRGYKHLYVDLEHRKMCKPNNQDSLEQELMRGYNFFFYHPAVLSEIQ